MVTDWIRRCYSTRVQFGRNSSRVAKIRWYWADPAAKDLGIPSAFTSRDWDQWEVWPEVGEVQYAPRVFNDGSFPIPVPGKGPPCGDKDVWLNGWNGTPPPEFPRNQFGISICCGGLIAKFGQPTFGLGVQVQPAVTPVVPPVVVGQDIVVRDDLADMVGTLDFWRKAIYPDPFTPRKIDVDELDDSNPQQQLIFG